MTDAHDNIISTPIKTKNNNNNNNDNFFTPNSSPIRASRIPIKQNSTIRKTLSNSPIRVKSTTTTEITRVWSTVNDEPNYEKFESHIDGYFNTSQNNNNSSLHFSHGDASRSNHSIQSPKPNYHLPPLTSYNNNNFTPLTRPKLTNSTPRVTHVLRHLPFVPTIIDYVYTAIFAALLVVTSHFISNNYKTIVRIGSLVFDHFFPGIHPVIVLGMGFSVCFMLKIVWSRGDLRLKAL